MEHQENLMLERKLVNAEILRVSNEFRNCKSGPEGELKIAKELATLTLRLAHLLRRETNMEVIITKPGPIQVFG